MKLVRARLFGLLSLVALLPCTSRAEPLVVDSNIYSQLRTEAIADWQSIEGGLRVVDVAYRFEYTAGSRDAMKLIARSSDRLVFDLDRNLAMLRGVKDGHAGEMSHRIFNPSYRFSILTPDVTARGTLLGVKTNADKEIEEAPDWSGSRNFLLAATRVGNIRLSELLLPEEFKLIEAVKVEEDGEWRIRTTATYIGGKKPGRLENATYTVVLDPTHRHRLLFATVTVVDPRQEQQMLVVTYPADENVDTPQRVEFELQVGNYRDKQTYTFESPKPWSIPEAEFYLPHYGFSEQVLQTLNPNPWPRWLLILSGVLSLVIGFWLLRRREPKPTA